MNSFLPLLWSILANITTVFIVHQKFARSLPYTFFGAIIVIYLSGMICHTFTPGVVAAIVYAFAWILFAIVAKNAAH